MRFAAQVNARTQELHSQLQVLRQRCDVSDQGNVAKTAEVDAARKQCSAHETQMNDLRRQFDNGQVQLQVARQNELAMKRQLDAEKELHQVDAQAAEELKQFSRKMYGVLREGALLLDKVPLFCMIQRVTYDVRRATCDV